MKFFFSGNSASVKHWKIIVLFKTRLLYRYNVADADSECLVSSFLKAFSSLAEAAYEAADVADGEETPETYCLSPYLEPIVQKLLETTER